jgi:hypothetical protein
VAGAPLVGRDGGLDVTHVLATTGPGGVAALLAADWTAHANGFLSDGLAGRCSSLTRLGASSPASSGAGGHPATGIVMLEIGCELAPSDQPPRAGEVAQAHGATPRCRSCEERRRPPEQSGGLRGYDGLRCRSSDHTPRVTCEDVESSGSRAALGPHVGWSVPARSTHSDPGSHEDLTLRHVMARGLVLDMPIRWTSFADDCR